MPSTGRRSLNSWTRQLRAIVARPWPFASDQLFVLLELNAEFLSRALLQEVHNVFQCCVLLDEFNVSLELNNWQGMQKTF